MLRVGAWEERRIDFVISGEQRKRADGKAL